MDFVQLIRSIVAIWLEIAKGRRFTGVVMAPRRRRYELGTLFCEKVFPLDGV